MITGWEEGGNLFARRVCYHLMVAWVLQFTFGNPNFLKSQKASVCFYMREGQ